MSSERTSSRWRWVVALVVVLAWVVIGCSSEDRAAEPVASTTTAAATPTTPASVPARPSPGCAASPAPTTEPAATSTSTEQTAEVVEVDGVARTYQRHVPADLPAGPRPLVVDLHGYQSGAAIQAQISRFDRVADREGFVLATPQGSGPLSYWNAVPHPDLPDDVAFIEAVLDDVGAEECIDLARVYVDGFSNGAFLTSLLACRLDDRIAAVATVSGLLRPEPCPARRAVPVYAIHGTADRFVGYEGENPALETLTWDDDSRRAFQGLPFAPVTETAAAWAKAAGCDADPAEREQADGVTRTSYDCPDGGDVVLDTVDGGGHTWPGSEFTAASASLLGPTSTSFDASDAIWSFFEAHPMSAS